MDRKYSLTLIGELERHPPLTKEMLDELKIFKALDSTDTPKSKRFYRRVEGDTLIRIPDNATDLDYYFLLRRILNNELAAEYVKKGYQQSQTKEAWGKLARSAGIYDSDALTRRLRVDPEMLKMMSQAAKQGQSFSLLGALESADKLSTKISKRPIVIIPGADIGKLVEWETANTHYFTQVSDKGTREIPREQYFRP